MPEYGGKNNKQRYMWGESYTSIELDAAPDAAFFTAVLGRCFGCGGLIFLKAIFKTCKALMEENMMNLISHCPST
jgi:hypothetical protein